MATIIDSLQIKRGYNNNVPTLQDGEPLITEDTNAQRLLIGTTNGNVSIPNNVDINNMQTQVDEAINTANTASQNISQALSTANNAENKATEALGNSVATQSQVANIIANGDTGSLQEIVDVRTDADGTVWTSAGDHVRNLDKNDEIYKVLYTFTSTSDNIATINIGNTTVDLTKAQFQIHYDGVELILTDQYTIDTTNRQIDLVGWTLDNGEKITYRILP